MRMSQTKGELDGLFGDFFSLEDIIKGSKDKVFLENLFFNLRYQTNPDHKLKMKKLILQKDLSCRFYKKALGTEEDLRIKEILFEKYIQATKNIFSFYVLKTILFNKDYVKLDILKFILKTWTMTVVFGLIFGALGSNPAMFLISFIVISFFHIISKGYTCEKFSMAMGIFFILALSPITVPLFIIAFLTILSEPESLSIGFFYHY